MEEVAHLVRPAEVYSTVDSVSLLTFGVSKAFNAARLAGISCSKLLLADIKRLINLGPRVQVLLGLCILALTLDLLIKYA